MARTLQIWYTVMCCGIFTQQIRANCNSGNYYHTYHTIRVGGFLGVISAPVQLDTHPLQPPAPDVQLPLQQHAQPVTLGPHARVVRLNRLRVPALMDTHPLRQPAQDVQVPLEPVQPVPLGSYARVVLLNLFRHAVPDPTIIHSKGDAQTAHGDYA